MYVGDSPKSRQILKGRLFKNTVSLMEKCLIKEGEWQGGCR